MLLQTTTNLSFNKHFRLSRAAFDYLHEMFGTNVHTNNVKVHIPIDKQLMCVIWLLATPESYWSVGDRFDLAKSTLSIQFFVV